MVWTEAVSAEAALLMVALLTSVVPSSSGLVLEVRVPQYQTRGSDARLACIYSLEGATLYSLKWYKGDSQFYQFIPANNKTTTTFDVPGVAVDVERCDKGIVMLSKVQLTSSGTYRCEVITEAPTFITKFGEGSMSVIDLPESAPLLDGVQSAYQIGEPVRVNCTSPLSKPAATLEWHINLEKVPSSSPSLRPYRPIVSLEGLETSILGLSFTAETRHFPKGELSLKCVARIATVYFQSQETSVIQTGFWERTLAEESRARPHAVRESNGASSAVSSQRSLRLLRLSSCAVPAVLLLLSVLVMWSTAFI